MSKAEPLNITIMGKEYRVACPPEEKDNLLASAELLNEKLEEIKKGGAVIGTERIAIMAALNMSHDVLNNQTIVSNHKDLNQRISDMSERISNSMRDIQLI